MNAQRGGVRPQARFEATADPTGESSMRFDRKRTIQEPVPWAFVLVVLAMTGCDDAVCPSGTTEQLGHCIRNSELDANVGTGGQQASTGSEGTAATKVGS